MIRGCIGPVPCRLRHGSLLVTHDPGSHQRRETPCAKQGGQWSDVECWDDSSSECSACVYIIMHRHTCAIYIYMYKCIHVMCTSSYVYVHIWVTDEIIVRIESCFALAGWGVCKTFPIGNDPFLRMAWTWTSNFVRNSYVDFVSLLVSICFL